MHVDGVVGGRAGNPECLRPKAAAPKYGVGDRVYPAEYATRARWMAEPVNALSGQRSSGRIAASSSVRSMTRPVTSCATTSRARSASAVSAAVAVVSVSIAARNGLPVSMSSRGPRTSAMNSPVAASTRLSAAWMTASVQTTSPRRSSATALRSTIRSLRVRRRARSSTSRWTASAPTGSRGSAGPGIRARCSGVRPAVSVVCVMEAPGNGIGAGWGLLTATSLRYSVKYVADRVTFLPYPPLMSRTAPDTGCMSGIHDMNRNPDRGEIHDASDVRPVRTGRRRKIWAHSGDSHLMEPEDLWTSRLPKALADRAPAPSAARSTRSSTSTGRRSTGSSTTSWTRCARRVSGSHHPAA